MIRRDAMPRNKNPLEDFELSALKLTEVTQWKGRYPMAFIRDPEGPSDNWNERNVVIHQNVDSPISLCRPAAGLSAGCKHTWKKLMENSLACPDKQSITGGREKHAFTQPSFISSHQCAA